MKGLSKEERILRVAVKDKNRGDYVETEIQGSMGSKRGTIILIFFTR